MRRNRGVFFILITLLVVIILTGCMEKKKEGNEMIGTIKQTEQLEPLTTKEYIMEFYDLTEEDFKGIDVDKIVQYNSLTEADLLEIRKENILGYFKLAQELMEEEMEAAKYDLSYLVEFPEFEGEYPSFDDIKYLAYSQNEAEGGYSFLYDFGKGKIYYANVGKGVYEDYRNPNEIYELTDEIREKMIQTLKDAKVNEWDYHYEDDTYPEPVCWYFGMEFYDGTVISNTGVTKVPETLVDIENVMESVRNPIE